MTRIYCPHDEAADPDGYVQYPDDPAPKLRQWPDYDLIQALGTAYDSYCQARLYDKARALDIVECEIPRTTGWRREYLTRLRDLLAGTATALTTEQWLDGICRQIAERPEAAE